METFSSLEIGWQFRWDLLLHRLAVAGMLAMHAVRVLPCRLFDLDHALKPVKEFALVCTQLALHAHPATHRQPRSHLPH